MYWTVYVFLLSSAFGMFPNPFGKGKKPPNKLTEENVSAIKMSVKEPNPEGKLIRKAFKILTGDKYSGNPYNTLPLEELRTDILTNAFKWLSLGEHFDRSKLDPVTLEPKESEGEISETEKAEAQGSLLHYNKIKSSLLLLLEALKDKTEADLKHFKKEKFTEKDTAKYQYNEYPFPEEFFQLFLKKPAADLREDIKAAFWNQKGWATLWREIARKDGWDIKPTMSSQ